MISRRSSVIPTRKACLFSFAERFCRRLLPRCFTPTTFTNLLKCAPTKLRIGWVANRLAVHMTVTCLYSLTSSCALMSLTTDPSAAGTGRHCNDNVVARQEQSVREHLEFSTVALRQRFHSGTVLQASPPCDVACSVRRPVRPRRVTSVR